MDLALGHSARARLVADALPGREVRARDVLSDWQLSRVERVRLADGSSLILKRSRRPLIDEGRVLQGLRLHRHIRGPTMTATGTPTDNVYTRIGVKGARHHGYTGARGYHPLLAIAAGTGEVLMSRLREGRANTARGAAHFLRETVGRVRYGGARGQLTVRADSGFYAHTVVAACREMDVRFSITIRQRASLRDLIEAIPEEDWTPIPYWMDGAADVAETTYTPFQTKPDAAPVRLIVRRVKPTPGSQLALFARYSYHAFITDRDGETLELEADHRRHAEVENAIRDLKYGVGLNHMPSARFAANGAWLDGADWSGRADRDHQDPQAAGLRSGGTDHPLGAPPHFASPPALALGNPVQSRLGPAASHSVPGLTASLQLTQRPRNLAPPRSRESPAAYPLAIPRIATPA